MSTKEDRSPQVEGQHIATEAEIRPLRVGRSRPSTLQLGERFVHLEEMMVRKFALSRHRFESKAFAPGPVLALESRRKRVVRPVEIAPPVEIKWSTEAEASWTAMVAKLDACAAQWANGDLSDTTVPVVESDQEKQRRQERRDGMDQAWDYLLSRVLDDMPEPERRRWLREQEEQGEFEERESRARRLASGSDTCLVNDYENETVAYIDC
ncbi:hypothetical protein DFH08DRAFT_966296 [Mycena albidolilacea]|uniref:Uncharacterized protein n=1 Tax=Mycena albidolilacea TaxID=1033008 RepID=A0AAD7EKP5_9AGAR|nr:hypothetical protein DFH08DRAFT_966296 [Mycena albidolilacea]